MNLSLYLAFALFAFSSAFTPGPNNFMLMSSGALFGFKRTIPHISGVAIGFNFVMLAALFGMGAIVAAFPWSLTIVKVAGAAWLAWLGLKFFKAAFTHEDKKKDATKTDRSRPFRFYEAVLFQWINPKALIMAIAAASAYIGISDDFIIRTALICGTYLFMGFASAAAWAVAGTTLDRLMSKGRAATILNIIMGALLVGTALMILTAKTHG
ncbi:MAG TPA: LysE family translocator [Hellea balneolensis]|uniref:LysE family translocator n=1 Tax=Hellea balneolensis TaxID=287478 RepID=A0A7C3CBW6_9PROT|nr:LysE family translocator [Hellea balneolensis]